MSSKFPISGPCCIKLRLKGHLPNHLMIIVIGPIIQKKTFHNILYKTIYIHIHKSFQNIPKLTGFKMNSFEYVAFFVNHGATLQKYPKSIPPKVWSILVINILS